MISHPKYSIVIQWSDESDCYVASLPEWGPWCKAYGETIEEVAKNAHEILDLLMDRTNDPDPLPDPIKFVYPGSNVVPMPDSADNPAPLRKRANEPAAA
jgi:predicted RNase H-like HicB family nuclease